MLAATKGAGSAADNADSRQRLTELPSETMLSHLERDGPLHARACQCRVKAPCDTCLAWDRKLQAIELRMGICDSETRSPGVTQASHARAVSGSVRNGTLAAEAP
jgi:hypothetical protein